MIIEDYKSIKSVTSKYPGITSKDAEKYVIDLYTDIKTREDFLVEARMKTNFLEEELKEKKSEFQVIKELFDIVYDTKEVKEIKNDMHLGIVTSDMDGRLH